MRYAFRKSALALLLVASAICPTRDVVADILSFQARGVLTTMNGGWFPDDLRAGDPFEVTYSFDTTAPAGLLIPTAAEYLSPITAVEITLGTTSYSWSRGQLRASDIILRDDSPGSAFDELYHASASMSTDDPFITYLFAVSLASLSTPAPTEAMNGVQLGAAPPDPAAFMVRGFYIAANYSDSTGGDIVLGDVAGEVRSLSAVPLPAAAWLLVSGMGCLSVWARRARRDGKQPCPG